MNNRTEAKLTDLSGMQKAINDILQQAWERGRKYGQNERPQGEWIFRKFDEETGIPNSYWCPFCGRVKAQVYDNFCGNCGAKMEVIKND